MSSALRPITSHETTHGEHGGPAPTDRSHSGASSAPEADGGESDEAQGKASRTQNAKTRHVSPPAVEEVRKASRKGRGKNVGGANDYRRLLNTIIDDACGRFTPQLEPLPSSQIGATVWSSAEKETFFAKLARCGPGDLRALSSAVGSKSEAEVHVYIRLLQEGVAEIAATLPASENFAMVDMPAAIEVEEKCEAALTDAAEVLARQLSRGAAQAEKAKYGDDWLIDETLAMEIERQIDQAEEEPSPEHVVKAQEFPVAGAVDGKNASLFASARLLRPQVFVQLSQDVFMNDTAVSVSTWNATVPSDKEMITEPAIYRTAFDDLHNLTVSLTRRLVQASLFQATTRLRATDAARADWTPKPTVKEIDVRTALEVLNFRPKWKAHWAGLPRRCGLEVYSDAKKYRDGRPGTKMGMRLSYEEVEAELRLDGFERRMTTPLDGDNAARDEDAAALEVVDFDSDDFTTASSGEDGGGGSDGEEDDEDGESGEEDVISADPAASGDESNSGDGPAAAKVKPESDDTDGEVQRLPSKRKRPRPLSPASFAKAELEYLNAFDKQSSIAEQRRLWEILGQEVPETLDSAPHALPSTPVRKRSDFEGTPSWRAKVRYEAEWERLEGGVAAGEFGKMEERGRVGRKRRRTLQGALQARASGSGIEGETVGEQDERSGAEEVDLERSENLDDDTD